ncbi:MAG: type 1 glutamine amidotransferase [Syntrophales bacterium]|jgi:GMP synthase (glutamine-hydrolysing)|nr:type 1 glutamine amidotransferase [Syntrophales bacterium]
MKVLFIAHNESDGSSLTWDFMRFHGVELTIVNPFPGCVMPRDPSGFDGIVSMGDKAVEGCENFMEEEIILLQLALKNTTPVLGISLGARILARACHVPVKNDLRRHAGWSRIDLTREGRRDILFYGLPSSMNFFHIQDDSIELPKGALHLARSNESPVQAFRYGNAYGLHFHLDVTPGMLVEWTEKTAQREKNIRHFEQMAAELEIQTRAIYGNFLWLIEICSV